MFCDRRPAAPPLAFQGNGPGPPRPKRESALPPWEKLRELARKHKAEEEKAKARDSKDPAEKSKVSVTHHDIRYEGLSLARMPCLSEPTGHARRSKR